MNLEYWEKLRQPPKEALKKITGGRLRGMTDISPVWRIKAVTEVFGVCGVGWKVEVVKKWTEDGPEGQVMAFVDINVYIKHEKEWSEPIPGNGGSMLVAKEKSGLYASDEAFKMATTDALSSAFKMLGVAADIYSGSYDGSKYNAPPPVNKSMIYMTQKQSDWLIKFCIDEKLEPMEIAKQYGISKKIKANVIENIFNQLKKDVESGEIGFRFAVPEGEEKIDDDGDELL